MRVYSPYLFTFLLALSIVSCGADPFKNRTNSPTSEAESLANSKKTTTPENSNCICTMEYGPVCGVNGKTYSNACQAKCDGISEFEAGECLNQN